MVIGKFIHDAESFVNHSAATVILHIHVDTS